MPTINPSGSASSGQPQRTTFRPPWVKEGPEPLPLPTAPWTLARTRDQKSDVANMPLKPSTVRLRAASIDHEGSSSSAGGKVVPIRTDASKEKSSQAEPAPVRKQSKITIVPAIPAAKSPKENGHQVSTAPKAGDDTKDGAAPKKKLANERRNKSIDAEQRSVNSNSTTIPVEIKSVKTQDKPAAPPLPPPPPPPQGHNKAPVSEVKAEKLETLRSRPRKRPDWGTLMKDIESVRKLKHVQCNDRSSPLLPKVKVKEGVSTHFMYESEKGNVHNLLLKEIQSGVSLKRVQTNDRSRPILEGLRKFRRQMTIEEQIQKATEAEVVEHEPDELDDIDKVRDDLQSTKQMLALELRNKEAVERENKRLLSKILHLESELEREKTSNKQVEKTPDTISKKYEEDLNSLKGKLQEQEKHAKEMENIYHDVVSQLDLTKNELENALKKNKLLENKLATSAKVGDSHALTKQPSTKRIPQNKETSDTNNINENYSNELESEYEEVTETEEEEESDESSADSETDKAALQEKRTARELKLLTTKLKALKDKEGTAQKERRSLRDQLKKQQKALREEKKKYKELQKEVDKMANLMKDDEEEEEAEDRSENEEECESESESESESEGSEDEKSEGDLPPEASVDDKKKNLAERAKRHESSLTVLKKGNYMLKANIDRLKDELFKQKEMSITLQEDLNSVLAELG